MQLTPLESILNRNIAASTAARELCRRLADKRMALQVELAPHAPLLHVQLVCDGEHVRISAGAQETQADATLSGTPLAFIAMLRAQEAALRAGRVRIAGDAEVAQAFRDLLRLAKPEFEEELARFIGDVPAHQLGHFAREAFAFGRRMVDSLAANASEFLQEESRYLATRVEVDEFIADVDRLREDVDRLEAKLAQLQRGM